MMFFNLSSPIATRFEEAGSIGTLATHTRNAHSQRTLATHTRNAHSQRTLATHTRNALTFLSIFMLFTKILPAQTLVNREWVQLNGIPDTIDYSASVLDNDGNLCVTTNTVVAGQQANILTMKYDRFGNLLWQDTYNNPSYNGRDYGTAICFDANGDILVAGVSQIAAVGSAVLVFKYDVNGTLLWMAPYMNGFLNAASAITSDNNNKVYFTGARYNLTTQTDYVTVKLDENGALQWASIYDYAALYDVPVGIEVDSNTGNVYVTGASASTSNNYDYATVAYDANGIQTNVNRVSSPGTGFDKALAFARDNAGNLYVTGSAFNQTTNSYDIKTLKLNASLVIQWIQTFDGAGLEDAGNSLAIDNQGNVIVGGLVTTANQGKDGIVIKYDGSGSLVWRKTYNTENQEDEIKSVSVDFVGNILATGNIKRGNETTILTLQYKPNGDIDWLQEYDANTIGNNFANDIKTDGAGDIYVVGRTFDGANYQNTFIKYEGFTYNLTYAYDNFNQPIYVNSHVIIRFDPSAVLLPFLESRERIWGSIHDYLQPSVISQMEDKLGFSLQKTQIIEVFKELTVADSLSITRIGDTIDVPKLWTTLLLVLPTNTNNSISTICQKLNELKPNPVWYAEPDWVAIPATNDPFWSQQRSLVHNVVEPEADINIQPAWNITTGRTDIRLGISDAGIQWKHEDFNKVAGDTTFSNLKIVAGKNYSNGIIVNINNNVISTAHGTLVGGTAGAIRNNGLGIAGVAGGDNMISSDSSGVSMVDLKTNNYEVSQLAASIIDASTNTGGNDIWANIVNCSWNFPITLDLDSVATFRNALKEAQKNHVVMVAARGNEGIDTLEYLAGLKEDWLILVGGSDSTGNWASGASWGEDLDIIAPFHYNLNRCTNIDTISSYSSSYSYAGGSSISAPYVSGTAGLMLSYYNDNTKKLYPEDIENILEITAYDSQNPAAFCLHGYDNRSGWGRLDAGRAVTILANPNNTLIQKDTLFGNVDTTYIDTIFLDYDYQEGTILFPKNPFGYRVLVRKVSFDFNYNPLGHDLYDIAHPDSITPNHTSFWVRNSASNLWGGTLDTITTPFGYAKRVIPEVDVQFEGTPTNIHGKIKGYYYEILDNLDPSNPTVPPFPNNILPKALGVAYPRAAMSILVSKLISIDNSESLGFGYRCYPNPTNDNLCIEINKPKKGNYIFSVLDLSGKVLLKNTSQIEAENFHTILPTENLSSGIYLYEIRNEEYKVVGKFVKY